jgi:hypothetical protein
MLLVLGGGRLIDAVNDLLQALVLLAGDENRGVVIDDVPDQHRKGRDEHAHRH